MIENTKITSFKDLQAWKEGHKLVIMVYDASREFPEDEKFGLISQIRRSAVSITSNIAEGFSRGSYKDKANFYSIALGSLTEAQNQLEIAKDLKYLDEQSFKGLDYQVITVSKLCNGLIKKTKSFYK